MSRRDRGGGWVMVFDRHGFADEPVDAATGLPLPPRDTRAGSFSCCVDCAAREPCGTTCPRYRAFSEREVPR